MFALKILDKIKETRRIFSQRSVTVLWKMENYGRAWVKLTNTPLKKLEFLAKETLEQHEE